MKIKFEEYWKANLLFRLIGVMGYTQEQANQLKPLFLAAWRNGNDK